MNIAPKLAAENSRVPPLIIPFLGSTAEFHLRNYYKKEETGWRTVVEQNKLTDVILHAPFGAHNLEDVCLSSILRPLVIKYMQRQREYAEQHNIVIHMLYHITYTVESASAVGFYAALNSLIMEVGLSDHFGILVENTIINLESGSLRLQMDPISCVLSSAPVGMCFDLCHFLASRNVVQDEYVFCQDWLDRVYSIHFSETRCNEGYKNFRTTHSTRHNSIYGVARDLCVLKEFGINLDDVRVVVEVSESDYTTRVDEAQELEWLYALEKEGITL